MLNWTKNKDKIGGGTNSTLLALVPKDINPSSFSWFRPISLCNASYKILTKILVNRIKPLLSKLISENQRGFMPNQHILNNIIMVEEALHSNKATGEKRMVIKLDMANVFDRVRHSFLFQVLEYFGLCSNLIKWVQAYIGSPWIAPLVNGQPT